ncbi:MAG TPA: GH3 auxin-responsive promoter family protein [Polyangia bacterium]|nr:GH3 auxin-responsive promoter family protein [Polyangia bacterium]
MSPASNGLLRVGRRVSHGAARLACRGAAGDFERALLDSRAAQLGNLERILRGVVGAAQARRLGLEPGMGPAKFRERVPEICYADVAEAIARQRGGARELTAAPCARYQPTSGSSAKVKWIPYTRSFLAELDAALSPWGFDLYRTVPGVARGRHYWSLSWVPTSLRASTSANVNDDRALLSPAKRAFTRMTSPVPAWVAETASSEDSLFATATFLAAADDLTLMSVWSPTFALSLFEQLAEHREVIGELLAAGAWGGARRALPGRPPRAARAARVLRAWRGEQDPAFFRELWPQLALVSAWETAGAARWARQLAELLPHAAFQGKGLWATEGVVTIPYRGRMPLAVRSHYFEFVDLESGRPCFSWELRDGQTVRPLLTTGGGLLRYRLEDRLVVRGFLGTTPCFEYLGRLQDVDMVGEKMSQEAARVGLDAIAAEESGGACRPLTLLAVTPTRKTDKPRYVALCEGRAGADDERRGAVLEKSLRGIFHYNLARDLGQLGPARVLTLADARRFYEDIGAARGLVAGGIKLEDLLLCDDARVAALVAERIAGRAADPAEGADAAAAAGAASAGASAAVV